MHPKWLIAIGFFFVIMTFVCITFEVAEAGSGRVTIVTEAMSAFQVMEFSNPLSGMWSIVTGLWATIKLIFNMLTWNYSFFDGVWIWVRYLLLTISVGVVVAIVLALRGTSSA